jgi:WD40 repeat protein
MDACSFCDWRPAPISRAKRTLRERERQGNITRRTVLGLLGGAGVLALGGGSWIWLTRKPRPQLLLYTGHHGALINSITWSPDGNSIASGDIHGQIRVWDTASGTTALTCQKDGTGSVSSVAWSPDSTSLLAGYANMLVIWDAQSGKSTFTTTRLTGPAAYSSQGTYKQCYLAYPLLIAACQGGNSVQIFPSTSLNIPLVSINSGPISELAFNPDEEGSFGLAVIATSPTRKLVLYEGIIVNTCAVNDNANAHLSYVRESPDSYADSSTGVLDISWGPGGSYMLGGTPPASVEIQWDYGKYVMQHPAGVVAAALCPAEQNLPAGAQPDGEYCVIGYIATADSAGAVRIWGNAQKYLTVMQTHQPVQSLAWSPDGKFLAIVTTDGIVQVWQAALSNLPALWTEDC